VEAVKAGNFHIYAVSHVDQGIEILTGIPAGESDKEGNYPEDSINGKVKQRLKALAEAREAFGESSKEQNSE
jgi:hypothetical protein